MTPTGTFGTIIRLKVAIITSGLRGESKRAFGTVVALLMALTGGILGFRSFYSSSAQSGGGSGRGLVIGFTTLFFAWVFGPLMLGGVDDSLDPRTLSLLPLSRRDLRTGLLGATLVGFLPAATILALCGVVAGYASPDVSAIVIVTALIVLVLLSLGASRLLSVGLARAVRSRKGRDLAIVIASLTGASLWLGVQTVRRLGGEQLDRAVGVLRWTPAGALGQAVLDARTGAVLRPALRIGAAAVVAVLFLWAWMAGLERLLLHPESLRSVLGVRREGARVLGRLGDRSATLVLAKELRYVARSPQRRSALLVGTIVGTVFALFQVVKTRHPGAEVVLGAPIGILFGIGVTNNLLGAEGPALWIELMSGATVRRLLIGRGLAAVPNLVLPQIVPAVVLGVLSHGWTNLWMITALAFGTWGLPLGVGTVISVIAPFPQPETSNPFSNRRVAPGEGCLIGVVAFIGLGALAVVAAPVVIGVLSQRSGDTAHRLLAVAGATVWSLLVWQVGLAIAERRTRGRENELMETLGAHQVNT